MDNYICDRIYAIITELGKLRFRKKLLLDNFSYAPCGYKRGNDRSGENFREFLPSEVWGGSADGHAVFKGTVSLGIDDLPAELIIRTGFEGWVDSNPQMLVTVNGEIIQGADRNHTSVRFDKSGKYEISVYTYTGMWVTDPLRFMTDLYAIDTDTEKLYYDLKVPFDALCCLDKTSRDYKELLYSLNKVLDIIDLKLPYGKEYRESVKKALDYTEKVLYPSFNCENTTVATVGHAHIDLAWMWHRRQTREKAQRSFSTVLSLMDRYGDFVFTASQPALYKMVKEDAPELYARIKKRVKEGRWEPQGATFVETDCMLTGGESIVRQILYGQIFFKEEFGKTTDVLWLPDSFGFCGQLPQIMKKSGLKFFITSKLSWNDTQQFPYDAFLWRGIDGTEFPAYFLTGQNSDSKTKGTTYNGLLTPCMVMGTDKRFGQKEISDTTLLAFGYGDGGGGPTAEFLETHKRLKKGVTACPKTEMTTVSAFADTMLEKYKGNKYLPKWTGDLYLEFHRGIYTTMSKNKLNNRKSEILYRNAELFSVISENLFSLKYKKDEMDKGWELILFNQFHDILPGSSIKEVYEDSDKDYAKIKEIGESVLDSSISAIEKNITTESGLIAYNSNGFDCDGITQINDIPVVIKNVPSLGFSAVSEYISDCSVVVSDKKIENDYYIAEFDENYNISRLYDKEFDREILESGKVGNKLVAFEDLPPQFDAWEINGSYSEKFYEITGVLSVDTFREGVSAGLKISRKFMDSAITQKIVFYSGSRRIDFITEAEWKTEHILVKALFPLNIHTDTAVCDTQFGVINRSTVRNTPFDLAKFEFCAHKFVDLSENDYGVALMNDCKYGYHALYNEIGITLLRCPTYPNPNADKGIHKFTYSLLPHKGDYVCGNVVKESLLFNNPITIRKTDKNPQGILGDKYSFITAETDALIIDTVKKAEDGNGIIIRLYETYNRRGRETLHFGRRVDKAYICDLTENILREIKVKDNTFTIEFKPFEIITLKLQ